MNSLQYHGSKCIKFELKGFFFSKKHCDVSSSCLSVQNVFDYYLLSTQHSVIIYPIVSILHIMNTSAEQKELNMYSLGEILHGTMVFIAKLYSKGCQLDVTNEL